MISPFKKLACVYPVLIYIGEPPLFYSLRWTAPVFLPPIVFSLYLHLLYLMTWQLFRTVPYEAPSSVTYVHTVIWYIITNPANPPALFQWAYSICFTLGDSADHQLSIMLVVRGEGGIQVGNSATTPLTTLVPNTSRSLPRHHRRCCIQIVLHVARFCSGATRWLGG